MGGKREKAQKGKGKAKVRRKGKRQGEGKHCSGNVKVWTGGERNKRNV